MENLPSTKYNFELYDIPKIEALIAASNFSKYTFEKQADIVNIKLEKVLQGNSTQ